MEKIQLQYDFLDTFREAANSRKELKEQVLASESLIQDNRVFALSKMLTGDEQAFEVQTAEKRRQALFARQMQALLGDEVGGMINDNAPIGQFATNMLERLDMNIRRQALRTYATRDIPIQYGGGALESVKGFKEAYSLPKGGFIGGDTNQVRIVNVEFQPQAVPVKPLTYGLRLGFVDSLKNENLGYDAITKNGEAIQRAWYLDLDRIAYVGTRGENGSTTDVAGAPRGLLNFEGVTATNLETTDKYNLTVKKLELLDINKVIEIIIGELNEVAQSVDFEPFLIPNKILFYKELFAFLTSTAKNPTGVQTPFRTNKAILQEALDMWCEAQDFDRIQMVMLPYLSHNISETKDASMVASGANETGRIVFYRQDSYNFYLPLPMDLTGGAVVFDINTNAFRRNYISFAGYILNFYNESVRYLDNGTTTGE